MPVPAQGVWVSEMQEWESQHFRVLATPDRIRRGRVPSTTEIEARMTIVVTPTCNRSSENRGSEVGRNRSLVCSVTFQECQTFESRSILGSEKWRILRDGFPRDFRAFQSRKPHGLQDVDKTSVAFFIILPNNEVVPLRPTSENEAKEVLNKLKLINRRPNAYDNIERAISASINMSHDERSRPKRVYHDGCYRDWRRSEWYLSSDEIRWLTASWYSDARIGFGTGITNNAIYDIKKCRRRKTGNGW